MPKQSERVEEVLAKKEKAVPSVTAPFGIIKDFEDLENFLFGLQVPGAVEAFKRLTRVRSTCAKCGMHVFVDWR